MYGDIASNRDHLLELITIYNNIVEDYNKSLDMIERKIPITNDLGLRALYLEEKEELIRDIHAMNKDIDGYVAKLARLEEGKADVT